MALIWPTQKSDFSDARSTANNQVWLQLKAITSACAMLLSRYECQRKAAPYYIGCKSGTKSHLSREARKYNTSLDLAIPLEELKLIASISKYYWSLPHTKLALFKLTV